MNRKLYLIAIMMLVHFLLKAQTSEHLNAGDDKCRSDDWKLIFYDEFDGSVIDATKWYTYNPEGCASCISRRNENNSSIDEDVNVVVSNGTCKLVERYQPTTITGLTDANDPNSMTSLTTNFTSAIIYSLHQFKYGKFEMRAKMSGAIGSHTTFWLWDQIGAPASEMDMLEYGDGTSANATMNYHTHIFPLNAPELSLDATATGDYTANFHVLTWIWDPYFIQAYKDGVLQLTFSKLEYNASYNDPSSLYYLDNSIANAITPANCVAPYTGDYSIASAYPWDLDHTMRLTAAVDPGSNISNFINDQITEVDYLRIYQREGLIESGYSDLCVNIQGPKTICSLGNDVVYTVFGEDVSNISWHYSDNFKFVSLIGNQLTLHPLFLKGTGWVSVDNNGTVPAGCTSSSYMLPITLGPPLAPYFKDVQGPLHLGHYTNILTIPSMDLDPYATYTWYLSSNYTPPSFTTYTGTQVYYVSTTPTLAWHISATNECGTTDSASFLLNKMPNSRNNGKGNSEINDKSYDNVNNFNGLGIENADVNSDSSVNSIDQIVVNPNPSLSGWKISLSRMVTTEMSAVLYNTLGKECWKYNTTNETLGTRNIYVPKTNAPGVYLLKVRFNNKQFNVKLVSI